MPAGGNFAGGGAAAHGRPSERVKIPLLAEAARSTALGLESANSKVKILPSALLRAGSKPILSQKPREGWGNPISSIPQTRGTKILSSCARPDSPFDSAQGRLRRLSPLGSFRGGVLSRGATCCILSDGQAPYYACASRGIMSGVLRWFERKFDFSFPLELYPNVQARLLGTPARLEEILRGCSPQVRVKKDDGGKWSAQEHAGHLADLEPLWLARVEDFVGGGTELTVADLQNRRTSEANHNARPLEEVLSGFRAGRMALVNRVKNIEPAMFRRTLVHPRMKVAIRLVDHLYFVAEHDDHHLARILELVGV